MTSFVKRALCSMRTVMVHICRRGRQRRMNSPRIRAGLSAVRFETERELVQRAIEQLPFTALLNTGEDESVFIATEVRGLFGIPDLIAARISECGVPSTKGSVAFEMKLSDWRRALIQAYRYKAFAATVYVVIDDTRSNAALQHREQFVRANVGLIGISTDSLTIHLHPTDEVPFCDHLRGRFDAWINAEQSRNGREGSRFPCAEYTTTRLSAAKAREPRDRGCVPFANCSGAT